MKLDSHETNLISLDYFHYLHLVAEIFVSCKISSRINTLSLDITNHTRDNQTLQ